VREPSAFLFDEPLSNLDARLRLEMRAEIARLHQTLGITMIYVTHDQVEAMTLGQRIAVIKDGQLQQYAPPLEVYREPANLFVATFIGSPPINTASGQVVTSESREEFRYENLVLDVSAPGYEGEAVLGIRPEALSLVTDVHEVDFIAEVARLEPLGNELLIHIAGPGENRWIARAAPDTKCAVGDPIGVRLDRNQIHLFAGTEMTRLA
jgi:multiple sugar transport system ATP-binding protein